MNESNQRPTAREIFWAFLKLGLTSFGGPVAHLGYFHDAFVVRRRWVSERAYADLVSLSQFLPGPASSQVGIALGASLRGIRGGLLAWAGFTLPSAVAMILFAEVMTALEARSAGGWLHGLKVVAVAVVANAVWGMARSMAPDRPRATLALICAGLVLVLPTTVGQVSAMALGAVMGAGLLQGAASAPTGKIVPTIRVGPGVMYLVLFAALLAGLPVLSGLYPYPLLQYADSFYRSGSLIFGGGHVVLPLLQAELVPRGWIGQDAFLAGYGAVQAVPGPLLTFSAYLGTAMAPPGVWRWASGLICLGAVFLPSLLLVFGVLPFWNILRGHRLAQAVLMGINAAVVGLLLAALYDPVWLGAIHSPLDFALALAAFGLIAMWRVPPWLVVLLSGLSGAAMVMV